MRKIFALAACMVIGLTGFSQIADPVKWTFSSKKIAEKTFEIHLTASIEDEWHIYSQTTPDGGPVPTSINFTRNPLITFEGEVKEVGKLEQNFEQLFGVQVKQFSKKVDFVQKVVLKAAAKTVVAGTVEFMVCNDRECMPPATVAFSLQIKS